MKKALRWLKRLFLFLLTLALLLLAAAYFLLGTETGYRQMPKIVNTLTPFHIHYDSLEGKLFGEQKWRGLHVTGPNGLDFQADALILDFPLSEVFSRHLHIPILQLSGSRLQLPLPSAKENTKSTSGIPDKLPQINLPMQIDVDAVRISNLQIIDSQQRSILNLDHANASLHGLSDNVKFSLDSKAAFGVSENMTTAAAQLSGSLSLKDDYPLSLSGDGSIQLPNKPQQDVNISLQGSALKPNLTAAAKGWTSGTLTASGEISLEKQSLNLTTAWKDVDYDGKVIVAPEGSLHLQGPFDNIRISMNADAAGSAVPAVLISGGADISTEAVNNINLLVKTLGGQLKFDGHIRYKNGLEWDGKLLITDIDAAKYRPNLNAALNGEIVTSGRQTADGLDANLEIKQLDGRWQQYPVKGDGKITVHGSTVQVDNFYIDFADNHLDAHGQIDQQTANLHAHINAPNLNRILPILSGSVQGEANITGSPTDPQIASTLSWKNLAVTAGGQTQFSSNSGKATASGTAKALNVQIQADGKGAHVPIMQFTASAQVTPTAVENIAVNTDTLQGNIKLNGRLGLSPQITWDASGKLTGVNPQELVPQLSAKVTADISAKGGIENGKVFTDADISGLSGSWQGQPLSGNAKAALHAENLSIETLDVGIGANQIQGKGSLAGEKLNFSFNLNGRQLTQIYPLLKGSLSGSGSIQGTTKAPIIRADFKGSGIAYQNNHIAGADIHLDTGLSSGANFNNRISLTGISAGSQRWSSVDFSSNGQFDRHHFSLKTSGGEYNANLDAAGGFRAINSWAGTLNSLNAQLQELNWHMRRPTPAAFSPQEIRLDNFCLADQYSALCIKIAKKADTLIDYRIEQIDPRSLKPFLPASVRINSTQLKGDGKITLSASGSLKGNADLKLTPGQIVINIPNQPPITLKLHNAALASTFTDRQAQGKLDISFVNAGQIHANALISSLRANPQLHGSLQLNIPDIGRYKYLIPQVSELKGNIKGDMQFAGPLSRPMASGDIVLDGGKVVIPQYATELNNIRLRLAAQKNGTIGIDGNLGTPKGNLTAKGVLRLQPTTLNLTLDGKNMLIANSKVMKIFVTPHFTIAIDPKTGIIVKGDVLIPEANISIPDTSSAVQPSEDVVIIGKNGKPEDNPAIEKTTPLQADIGIRLGDKVRFKTKDVNIRLKGGLMVLMRPGQTIQGKGRIEVAQGVYELYGQELDIKRGWVTFSGNIANPSINVLATRDVEKVSVGAKVTGTAQKLRLDLTSDPAMPDSAILSYLLFGKAPDSGTNSTELLQTAAAIGTKGFFPDNLAEKTGLDVFDLGIGGLKAGKYLLKDIYVGVKSDFFSGVTKFLARYQITDRLSVEASNSNKDGSAIDMTYQFETN